MCDQVSCHDLRDRISVGLGAAVGVASFLGVVALAIDTWKSFSTGNPECRGTCLAPYLFAGAVGILLVLAALCGVRYHWFYLYRYALSGNRLHAFDPILRTRWELDLGNVKSVRVVPALLSRSRREASTGYVRILESGEGVKLRLSVFLPLWPEIASHIPDDVLKQPEKE